MSSSPLDRALAGDGRAFGELIAPFVHELRLHCYRMIGSLAESEDLLQETLTAAWRGLDGYEGRASIRAWLYRIATNRCLNAIRDVRRRVPAEPVAPFRPPQPTSRGEQTWLEPCPDAWWDRAADETHQPAVRLDMTETVELAFVAALQRLPPRQMAALVLADVLDFSIAEIAVMIDGSATSVKGLLQRARTSVRKDRADERHEPSGGRGSSVERDLARRFAVSFAAGDVDRVVALLTDDVWLAMPPAPHQYCGPVAVASFLRAGDDWRAGRPMSLVPTRASGQPAFGCYLGDPDPGAHHPASIIVLTMRRDRISRITRFLGDALPRYFGFPDVAGGTG